MSRAHSEASENYFWQQFEERPAVVLVAETTIFSLVMILSLFGNLLVCYAVYKNPRLRCPSSYYIISLALTDILQAICSMPLSVVLLGTSRWSFGTPACYFAAITKLSLSKTSVYTMALMALNRYYKIVKPARFQALYKKKFIIITALLAWVIPIIISLLAAFALDKRAKPNPGYAICILEFHQWFFPILSVIIYLPYFIIGFCYWKIYKLVKMHNANVSWQSSNVEDVKVSKTLFATVIAFFSFWLPAHIIYTASILVGYFRFSMFVTLLATLLVYMTSCVNPFIYGFMNRTFKAEFKKCLIPGKKRSSVAAESS